MNKFLVNYLSYAYMWKEPHELVSSYPTDPRHPRKFLKIFLIFSTCDTLYGLFRYISNKMQRYTVYLFLEICSTCFGWYFHPSSGAHTTVFTASGTCQTVTSTCRYCGRVGNLEFHLTGQQLPLFRRPKYILNVYT